MRDPWLIVGWMGVVFGAYFIARFAWTVLVAVHRQLPAVRRRLAISTGLARCEWFEWRDDVPSWPNRPVRTNWRGQTNYHCRARATHRLDYGALRCTEHKRCNHGNSHAQAHPLRRAS